MNNQVEPVCYLCGNPIKNNQGTYWVKGTGGLFSRGVYPKTVVSAHWGKCAHVLGEYFSQFPPDEKGEFWFWHHLPFSIQSDEETSNSHRFIYVLKSGEHYKIGITRDVEKRMRNLQTGDPVEHMFVCSSFSKDAPSLENRLHRAFAEYRKTREWFTLPPEQLERVIEILGDGGFIEQVPPMDNVVYYPSGTRVLWRSQPGVVHSLVIKPYKYEVGYNIVLDTQVDKDDPEVTNSGYGELVLEDSKLPSIQGYKVEPIDESDSDGRTSFTLREILGLS